MASGVTTRKYPWIAILPFAVFACTAAFLYCPDILAAGPRGIHFIRQTDSISFLMNYGRPSWDFFTPAIYSLREAPVNGHTVAEFPLFYYLAAIGRELFGAPSSSLRTIHLLVVLAGHVLLSFTAGRWLGSIGAGTFFSLWMYSSSVVVFYAANFLPDAAAYGLVLCGLCWVLRGADAQRPGVIDAGLACLTLAALIKAPTGIYLLAALGTGVVCLWRGYTFMGRRNLVVAAVGLLLGAGWHTYAIAFNELYHTHYFMTWAEPIWAMDGALRRDTWGLVSQYWWTKYHHPTTWHILAVLLVVGAFMHKHVPAQARMLMAFLAVAFCAYLALFFRKFADHDYYFLTVAPISVIGALTVLAAVKKRFSSRGVPHFLAGAMVILSIMGMTLSVKNLHRRYDVKDAFTGSLVLEGTIAPVLREHGISTATKAVVLGDPTPNGALLFMDMKGWAYGPGEPLPPLDSLIDLGAGQLLVLGNAQVELSQYPLIHRTNDWRLFRLHHQSH